MFHICHQQTLRISHGAFHNRNGDNFADKVDKNAYATNFDCGSAFTCLQDSVGTSEANI